MAAAGTLVDLDTFDVDLPTWKGEGIGCGATLEIAATTLLAGTRFWHGVQCRAGSTMAHQLLGEGSGAGDGYVPRRLSATACARQVPFVRRGRRVRAA